jgi:hypothetical protein
MLWLDDMTRARAIRCLLATAGIGDLWSIYGPTPRARAEKLRGGTGLSQEQRILLSAAWALWDGSGTLRMLALMPLAPGRLEAVISLLGALSRGPAAVDAWISAHEVRSEHPSSSP